MKRFLLLLFFVAPPLTRATAHVAVSSTAKNKSPIRILLVVAHPDDEYEVAATVYRITKELGGTVDQLIVTNGEAGYRYSSLAEPYYGVALTNESVGRSRLPLIRKEEARRAGKILGIRRQWFLNEKDEQFTLNGDEVLRKSWNQARIIKAIRRRLRQSRYDFLFVLLPTDDAHGEHKAATILALKAVEAFPADQRPIILGVQAGSEPVFYRPLPGYPITATNSAGSQFQFDRNVRFGYHQSLSYQIVVDWVIAEHKSQGLFQTRCLQDRFENFWIFSLNPKSANTETAALFDAIRLQLNEGRRSEITGANN